jgi:protein-tyrosine phosphatase
MIRCLFFILGIFTLANIAIAAQPPCNGTKLRPCVVQDTQNNPSVVKRWRAVPEILKVYHGDITGLNTLWESGSATPSAMGFKTIAKSVKQITHNQVRTIIDVDLRQESHGYINQDAVTLVSRNDWINKGNPAKQALQNELTWLAALKTQRRIYVLTPHEFNTENFSSGKYLLIKESASESEVAKQAGLGYLRLMITDHLPPDNAEVDKFVALVDNLSQDTWLHIHCRGGAGRTTTFMAMYDMMKNANSVTFASIIERQASIPPYYNLLKIERKAPSLTPYYQQRLQFLKQFYQFARAHTQGRAAKWSEWYQHQLH